MTTIDLGHWVWAGVRGDVSLTLFASSIHLLSRVPFVCPLCLHGWDCSRNCWRHIAWPSAFQQIYSRLTAAPNAVPIAVSLSPNTAVVTLLLLLLLGLLVLRRAWKWNAPAIVGSIWGVLGHRHRCNNKCFDIFFKNAISFENFYQLSERNLYKF